VCGAQWEYVEQIHFFNPVAYFLYKAKDLSVPPYKISSDFSVTEIERKKRRNEWKLLNKNNPWGWKQTFLAFPAHDAPQVPLMYHSASETDRRRMSN
jgi:hypothetical protein